MANTSPRHRRFWIVLLVLCAIGAAVAMRRIVMLASPAAPPSGRFGDLDTHFGAKAGLTLLHLIPSLLFVCIVPLQFVTSLRRRRPRLHRWLGRIAIILGIGIGISALRLSAHPVGGLAESTATIFFGCFFLFSLAKAWWHIRHGRIQLHREWATRMTSIALGVASTRPIMGVFFATSGLSGLTPEQFFGPAMWLGFVSTYLAGQAWIEYTRSASRVSLGDTRESYREARTGVFVSPTNIS